MSDSTESTEVGVRSQARRDFLGQGGMVLACAGLTSLLGRQVPAKDTTPHGQAVSPLRVPHFAPKAKRAIYLFMHGGPSQFETWDYKPRLASMFDQDLPESVRGGQVLTSMSAGQSRLPIAPSVYKFQQHGQAGHWVSDLLPWTAKVVDELAIVKSVHTDAINHEPANLLLCTGAMFPGKPSMGAWLSYGLGAINEELPTFVVMSSKIPKGMLAQALSNRLWSAGFLPTEHSAVALRSGASPVLHLDNPAGVDRTLRRAMLDSVNDLNHEAFARLGDPQISARIAQYEMAFRMQASVPELIDLSSEPASTWDLYGEKAKEPGTFAHHCLMARRLAERGVRFTQIFQRNWDHHGTLPRDIRILAQESDRPTHALITDLKRRGMLDDTLVIWGGEFGRTVYSQGTLTKDDYGRDHHPRCFTVWMAGGGIKPGFSYGETDDFSYNIVKDPVHVRDLHATLLHQFGINHEKLTFKFQGLDQKLTGVVPAKVVSALVA